MNIVRTKVRLFKSRIVCISVQILAEDFGNKVAADGDKKGNDRQECSKRRAEETVMELDRTPGTEGM